MVIWLWHKHLSLSYWGIFLQYEDHSHLTTTDAMKDNYYQHLQLPSRDEYPCHAKQWPTPPSVLTRILYIKCQYLIIISLLPAHPTAITQSTRDGCSSHSHAALCMPYDHVGQPSCVPMVSCTIPAFVLTISIGLPLLSVLSWPPLLVDNN